MPDADVRVGGRYRLGRQLASGGMGAVWEGWDERLHRTVAIKRLHVEPWLSDDERNVGVQRAMREARLAARLHHPHVVQVFDIVDDADSPCLIMEYVPSRSLHEVVRERGTLPPDEAARIGAQTALGLAAAHAAGIVHRDVKPGNVLIGEDGTAKVSDFGISHAFDDVTVTSTGLLVGTPAYLAPEVARGGSFSVASDVYSLGATLYLAVEGRPPFGSDENAMAVLHRVASGQWEPPARAGALAPLIARMMDLDPQQRPSMQDVAAELAGVRQHEAAPAGATQVIPVRPPPAPRGAPQEPPAPPAPPAPRRGSRPGLLPVATCVLGLILAVVLAIVLTNGDGGGAPDRSSGNQPTVSGDSTSGGAVANPPANGAPGAQELAAAITRYFQVVPGDLQTGWTLLTRHFQVTKAQNWPTYRDYWNSVDHVAVTNVQGTPPHAASADLVYYYDDGRVVPQHTTFHLIRQGGALKINAES